MNPKHLPCLIVAGFVLAGCTTPYHRAGSLAEDLNAPPPVTAQAWAIADGRTGELLWGLNADEPRKAASTTKMMCAFVILELAAQQPAVLDEVVTFSQLADDTVGSTADINAGEQVSVRECLYGLLLPSGNDAGNALAEHFNDRLAPPDERLRAVGLGNPALATRANFIAEMNRTAQRLGMTNTIYRSSFGDGGTPDDRTITARDLTRLAWHAMQNARFREYVSTQRYEARVQTPDGGTRTAVWSNTNQLLPLNVGYDGIKTGTTTQAGACLVSSGRRGSDHLLMAVLGSESASGRYVDSRNLYRWAWQQRGFR
ncbi:MAG: D-alanyl-D-alanine carboxypeptidase [Verrucomicrobiae bacterium]|nr:D-alanyl-D-alanine carboxypeptidase [Verrucomicrobiae bacterium]